LETEFSKTKKSEWDFWNKIFNTHIIFFEINFSKYSYIKCFGSFGLVYIIYEICSGKKTYQRQFYFFFFLIFSSSFFQYKLHSIIFFLHPLLLEFIFRNIINNFQTFFSENQTSLFPESISCSFWWGWRRNLRRWRKQ